MTVILQDRTSRSHDDPEIAIYLQYNKNHKLDIAHTW